MRSTVRLGTRFAAAVLALAVTGLAHAQFGDDAVLNAITYRAIPAGAPIFVRTLDDSDENTLLKRQFEAELRGRGYRIGEDMSGLVLTLEVSDQLGFWSYNSGSLIDAQRGYNELARKDLDSYMVNLFDSRRGGLINRPDRPADVNPSQYRLEARLEDRRDGRTLWQGWVSADLSRGGGSTLLRAMVKPLAASLGRSVREQPVTLR